MTSVSSNSSSNLLSSVAAWESWSKNLGSGLDSLIYSLERVDVQPYLRSYPQKRSHLVAALCRHARVAILGTGNNGKSWAVEDVLGNEFKKVRDQISVREPAGQLLEDLKIRTDRYLCMFNSVEALQQCHLRFDCILEFVGVYDAKTGEFKET